VEADADARRDVQRSRKSGAKNADDAKLVDLACRSFLDEEVPKRNLTFNKFGLEHILMLNKLKLCPQHGPLITSSPR
jgi:hypothetical protein